MSSKEKNFIFRNRLKNCSSLREYQIEKQIDFKYIWQASIPESWGKIMEKKKIHKLQLLKQSRNTLDFLTETQKYISNICMPNKSKDLIILPTVHKSLDKLQIIPDKYTEMTTRRGSGFNKAHILKSQLSLNLRLIKSQSTSPNLLESRKILERVNFINNK